MKHAKSRIRCSGVRRPAFTLVELLVVMAIIITLAAITVAFLPKREVQLAAQGADQLQTYLASARSRALRDQVPCGVRLIAINGLYRSAELIETPEPLAPRDANPTGNPAGFTTFLSLPEAAATKSGYVAHQVGYQLYTEVLPGDLLEIMEGTTSVHRISGVSGNAVTLTSVPPIAYATTSPPARQPIRLGQNYRYIRQPRPLAGEPVFQLPENVFVAPMPPGSSASSPVAAANHSYSIPTSPDGYPEIVFAPSGQVLGVPPGRIVLWITDVNSVSKPTLLTVYTRTGAVAAHEVNYSTLNAMNVIDPFLYTRDGANSGQ